MESKHSVRAERRKLLDLLARARAEIHKEILGQEELIDTVLFCLVSPGRHHNEPSGGNLLIEGAHGLGKTRLVKTLGRVLNLSFSRIQFVVDLDPSSITGSEVEDKETKNFIFRPGSLFANLVLADEITRAPGKTQSALFEGMEEQAVTVGGKTHYLPRPFYLFATTNIAEEIGTVLYGLPVGQRDRFFMSIRIDPPTEPLERKLYQRTTPKVREGGRENIWEDVETEMAGPVLDAAQLARISFFIASNYVISDSPLNHYITRLVRATRIQDSVLYGASPRAGFDLTRAAMTAAFMNDVDTVTEEHVLAVFVRVVRLRILLAYKYEREKYRDDRSIEEILDDIVRRTPLFERRSV